MDGDRSQQHPPHRRVRGTTVAFVLPNLLTLGNLLCGYAAIIFCIGDLELESLRRASWAIFAGAILDTLDGRVARLTGTQSDLGKQLDALADLTTFGVAPAVFLYRWCLNEMDLVGAGVAAFFLAAGALRLARFNVLAARDLGPKKFFVGLPIPVAASTIVALFLASSEHRSWGRLLDPRTTSVGLAALTAALGGLMVSRARYRTYQDLRPCRNTLAWLSFLLISLVVGVVFLGPWTSVGGYLLAYIALGGVEEARHFVRKRA